MDINVAVLERYTSDIASIIYVNMQNKYMYMCLKFHVSITNILKVSDINVA